MVRVRFAPSPTGFLHVGGARTALFNWLFARKNKGVFVLRIEDTDELRSTPEAVGQIIESLKWLGLDWDEGPLPSNFQLPTSGDYGPYFQMQRLDLYKKHAEDLKEKGSLYECYCSEEELEDYRREAMIAKRPPRYSKRCRTLADRQKKDFSAQGRKFVLRFKAPEEGSIGFEDMIRGGVSFESADLEDFVVVKSSGVPTYNFACVVDDHLMEITHVIRGDDHISNTPKQLLIFDAFGWTRPTYAHLSMILGPDGTRLSKRHGATSVLEFKEQGYLPQALVNYLALLGWATQTSQDLFEPLELIQKFEIERCQKSPATFDYSKLIWMNGIYIRKFSKIELCEAVKPFLPPMALNIANLEGIVSLEQEKYKTLKDAGDLLHFFFAEDFSYCWEELDALRAKSDKLRDKTNIETLTSQLLSKIEGVSEFNALNLEQILRSLAKELGLKTSDIFHPTRFAVSGRLQGPSLFSMLETVGKDRVLGRLARFKEALKSHG